MNINKRLWGIILLVTIYLALNSVSKAETLKLSLTECISLARENSPIIKRAQNEIGITKAKLKETRAEYMPKINARLSYNYYNTNNVIKTKLPDTLVNNMAQNAVLTALRDQALISGKNPISNSSVTELDILSNIAAAAGNTPLNELNNLTNQSYNEILATKNNILLTPMLGTQLFNTELSLQQPIFLWGKVHNTYKKNKAEIQASQSALKKLENDVTYNVTENYYQVLLAKDGLVLANATREKFSSLLDLIDALYKGDSENITKLDYLETKTYIGSIMAKLAEQEKALSLAKATLKESLGIDNTQEIDTLEETQFVESISVDLQDTINKSLLNRPDINELEHLMKAKEFEIKASKAENKPKLLLDSALDINIDNRNYLEPDPVDFRLSVIADIPLFNGFKTGNTVKQRSLELEKLKNTRQEIEQKIILEATEAVLSVEEAQKKLIANKEAVEAAEENQKLAREGFELEIVEPEKVIKAQLLEAKIKSEYLLSIFNYNIAKAKLKRATNNADSFSSFAPEIQDIAPTENINTKGTNQDLFLNTRPESIL